jgi:2-polyprenyl-3-methyl-5-hydroxy-6-metoxy-1,4-benzoquinol methylase
MSQQTADLLEKIRQQFDAAPYPRTPLETTPKNSPNDLYIHNLITSFYLRNRQVISTEGKLILDAGCGTGYKSLILALANPGAKIVGVDLSDESIKLARHRLEYHHCENAEFYTMPLEELPSLGLQFDYINNDEVLYLLPDPVAGLQAMKSVLKPDGIIRTNFHSSLQRFIFHRGQELFTELGLMEGAPDDEQLALVREVMRSLKDHIFIKTNAWREAYETDDQLLLANYLLRGDKGWTIPEFFAALRAADLEFINMVNWRNWDLTDLFKSFDELPVSLLMNLADKSIEEQLHLFELVQPVHRLLDLWCGHPDAALPNPPVSEWSWEEWQHATVHLHPQINTPQLKDDLMTCVVQLKMFEISKYLRLTDAPVNIDSAIAACLVPLTEAPQPVTALVERWTKIRPVHPVTLEPTDPAEVFDLVQHLLIRLEELGYVLLETHPE